MVHFRGSFATEDNRAINGCDERTLYLIIDVVSCTLILWDTVSLTSSFCRTPLSLYCVEGSSKSSYWKWFILKLNFRSIINQFSMKALWYFGLLNSQSFRYSDTSFIVLIEARQRADIGKIARDVTGNCFSVVPQFSAIGYLECPSISIQFVGPHLMDLHPINRCILASKSIKSLIATSDTVGTLRFSIISYILPKTWVLFF